MQDAHSHFFGRPFFDALAGLSPRDSDGLVEEVAQTAGLELPDPDTAVHAARWLSEMDAHGVERMVTFASAPPEAAVVAEAAAQSDGQLIGYTVVDPTAESAVGFATKALGEMGLRGLLTFPVTIPQLIAGKFLASMSYLALLLLLTLGLPITMGSVGTLDWYPVIVTYFAALLMAASYVAVGMFWSSVTRDQIIALILSVVMLGLLYLVGVWGPLLIGEVPVWLGGDHVVLFILALSPQQYFGSISRGVADTGDLVFYAAFCVFFLHANALVLYGKKVKG